MGFGELDAEPVTDAGIGELLDGSELWGLKLAGALASASAVRAEALPTEVGRLDALTVSACEGDADKDGVLNGMKDTDGLLPTFGAPSADRSDDFDPCSE